MVRGVCFVFTVAVVLGTATSMAAPTGADTVKQQVNIPGGRVKVSMTSMESPAAPSGPRTMPKVGVSPSSLIATSLARALDNTGKATVLSPARFTATSVEQAGGFDTLTRSEFADSLANACTRLKLDYALYAGSPQMSSGMSTSVFLMGFGRMKQTQAFEMRLYDCRSKQPVWTQSVAVEDSSGLWTNMIAGKMSMGGSQSVDAATQIIATKLAADMGW